MEYRWKTVELRDIAESMGLRVVWPNHDDLWIMGGNGQLARFTRDGDGLRRAEEWLAGYSYGMIAGRERERREQQDRRARG